MMWDASTMNEVPIVKAKLNFRVPYGFHSHFVRNDELEEENELQN